jgi:hypothetical protein
MIRSLKLQLAIRILLTPCCPMYAHHSRPEKISGRPLSIHVCDLANLSPRALKEATREAARVLASAGAEVTGQQIPADSTEAHAADQSAGSAAGASAPDARGYLVVRIIRGFPAHALPGALGYAFPDTQSGVQATVFYDRIEALNRVNAISVSTLLGHAMAHEIGHVLLGTTEPSPGGIMKARWGKPDYQRAAMGYLEFTPFQRAAVQERLLTRLAGK